MTHGCPPLCLHPYNQVAIFNQTTGPKYLEDTVFIAHLGSSELDVISSGTHHSYLPPGQNAGGWVAATVPKAEIDQNEAQFTIQDFP